MQAQLNRAHISFRLRSFNGLRLGHVGGFSIGFHQQAFSKAVMLSFKSISQQTSTSAI